jgi:predicted lipid carrier protein YhbT
MVMPELPVPVSAKVLVPVPPLAVTVELPATPTFKLRVLPAPVREIGFAILIVFEIDSLSVVETPSVRVELKGEFVALLYVSKRATACKSAFETVSAGAEFVTLTSSIAR